MIKVTCKSVAASVVFGLLITLGYLANMEYIPYYSGTGTNNCVYDPLLKNVNLVTQCSGLSYGYPQHYISSWPSLDYEYKDGQIDTSSLSVGSKVNFDILAFVTNLVIWSGVSFAVLTAVNILMPKSKKSKKIKK